MKRRVERTWVLYDMVESCPSTRLGLLVVYFGVFSKRGGGGLGLVCTVLDAKRD